MNQRARGALQTATVIAKTTQTEVGQIDCGGYDFVTLFIDYNKGDETGLLMKIWQDDIQSDKEYQMGEWAVAGGAGTFTATSYTFAASAEVPLTLDVRGVERIVIYQGGSNNDGTPTGTLAVSYFMQG